MNGRGLKGLRGMGKADIAATASGALCAKS
jgi:hypothetical protein